MKKSKKLVQPKRPAIHLELESTDQTAYLLSTQANAKRLAESISQVKTGKLLLKDL